MDGMAAGDRPVIIFGADRGGWIILEVLRNRGIEVGCFADNAMSKQGVFFGHPVYAPERAAALFPDADVFLGLLSSKHTAAITSQLWSLGFTRIHDAIGAFVFEYRSTLARRACDQEQLARASMALGGMASGGTFASPPLSYMITQKCTLRCVDCGTLVPHFQAPKTIPADRVIEDLKRYCAAFDVVHSVALIGGEPLLHAELLRICREVSEIPNVLFVDVVTNGTITLPQGSFDEMARLGVCVTISDYGAASRHLQAVETACRNSGMFYYFYRFENVAWSRMTPIERHDRGGERNTQIYKKCIQSPKTCCIIMDGELHRCSLSCMASYLGLIPRFEGDFVRLDPPFRTPEQLRQEIRDLLDRETAPEACDYCIGWMGDPIPAGVQPSRGSTHE